jgi:ATP-binding cassette subfamily F protein uup
MGVLEDYLRSFEGCLIVVSHDRYFMDKMVDHLFVFEGNGEVKDIIGAYSEYRSKQKKSARQTEQLPNEPREENNQQTEQTNGAISKEKRKLSYKEQKEFDVLESEIEVLELKKQQLTTILSSSESSNEQIMQAGEKLAKTVAEIEEKTDRWLELAELVV